MAKLRITLDVDTAELFDMLRRVGDGGALGNRLAGVLLTGEASLTDALGLSIYGVKLASSQKITKAPAPKAPSHV
jgi:hypothetical protein